MHEFYFYTVYLEYVHVYKIQMTSLMTI